MPGFPPVPQLRRSRSLLAAPDAGDVPESHRTCQQPGTAAPKVRTLRHGPWDTRANMATLSQLMRLHNHSASRRDNGKTSAKSRENPPALPDPGSLA